MRLISAAAPIAPPSSSPRLAVVDALRGFAVAQMIAYHFIYDLNYFGWLHLAMNRDQPWVGWRTLIVTQFLLLVGVSLALRAGFKPHPKDFWKRWAQVAASALLVSIGSWFMFGPRFIWFGILHFVAAALLIVRPLQRLGAWNVLVGLSVIAAGLLYVDGRFNPTPLNILGFATGKPRTEDYVPLFPWLGVVLIGAGLGSVWQKKNFALTAAWARFNQTPPRPLVFLGRWALSTYLLHQPILIGVLWLIHQAKT